MKIDKLVDTYTSRAEKYNKLYQKTVINLIKKYGYDNAKIKKELAKAIKPIAKDMVANGINLSLAFEDV